MVLAATECLAVGCHVPCRSRKSRKGEKEEELAMPSICGSRQPMAGTHGRNKSMLVFHYLPHSTKKVTRHTHTLTVSG